MHIPFEDFIISVEVFAIVDYENEAAREKALNKERFPWEKVQRTLNGEHLKAGAILTCDGRYNVWGVGGMHDFAEAAVSAMEMAVRRMNEFTERLLTATEPRAKYATKPYGIFHNAMNELIDYQEKDNA